MTRDTNLFTTFIKKYPASAYIVKWCALASIVGLLAGSASAFFLISLDYVTDYRESNTWIIFFLPVAGFLSGLAYFYFGKNIDAGNNIILENIQHPKERISILMAPFIYLGTMLSHLFGASAGREGTALQMAASLSDQLSGPFNLSAQDRRTLLIAAVAAGFGSVFGTPLAGAVFGLEFYLIGKIRYDSVFPAFASAIAADLVTRMWGADHTHYHIPVVPTPDVFSIGYAILAGIAFGLCAAGFSKSMVFCGNFFKNKIPYAPLRPVAGGIIIVALYLLLDTTKYLGLGIPTIELSFQQSLPSYDFALKMLFTIITLSAGFKGGEVTPLFFIGAALGNALAFFIPLPIALLAGMGFVAVFAGATNTPLACTLMAMELFGSSCGIFVALACTVAYLLSGHTSIYKKQLVGEAKHSSRKVDEGKSIGEL